MDLGHEARQRDEGKKKKHRCIPCSNKCKNKNSCFSVHAITSLLNLRLFYQLNCIVSQYCYNLHLGQHILLRNMRNMTAITTSETKHLKTWFNNGVDLTVEIDS